MNDKLKEFQQLVTDHDVHFAMSDDNKVWKKGWEEYQVIMEIYNNLVGEYKQELDKIWEGR